MKVSVKYIVFPIQFLKNLRTDTETTINQILGFGVYHRALKLTPDIVEVEPSAMLKVLNDWQLDVSDIEARLNLGRNLYQQHKGQPTASVKVSLLLEIRDSIKSEFELMVICAFCGFKSMIGSKLYLKTTDEYLLSRMFGYATIDEYQNAKTTQWEQDLRVKYSKRYHLDKIKKTLQNDWGLVYYSRQTRGFYVSFILTLKDLLNQAEDRRDRLKQKEIERQKIIESELEARKIRQPS
jgi:hypothetical protein